ncbi:hypothetical protein [Streptomyces albireticuli]|nr:hypothetical protein [Streptomyces albireticuli]MCD9143569.1 hypothetical protein [Streptomyces albireticuli]MCD9164928.1 hypothetical protein [Streptomyces albireticuli]MCD9191686.1 hypothetical protein [Streptomyces albireticuli]
MSEAMSGVPDEPPGEAAQDPADGLADGADERAGAPDAAGPRPLGVDRAPTGDAAVDAQLRRLADADHLAASGHLEVYEDVHRGLRDALTALDRHPGPPAPSGAPASYDNRS